MSSKFAICVFAIASTLAASSVTAQPTLNYQSHELKEGRNYVQNLTALLAVGESSGDLAYRYPFDIPPSRGATPELALEYSSHGGPTEYGWGWQLTIPMIERSDQSGVPIAGLNPFRQDFRYREGQTVRELVSIGGNSGGWQLYREAQESTYSRYYFNSATNQWIVQRTNGVRYDLGSGNAKRGTNPGIGSATTSAWLVNMISDTHGNQTLYTYQADAYAVPPLLNSRISGITYNGNAHSSLTNMTISFSWSPHWIHRFPSPIWYRDGFRREFGAEALTEITIQAPHHATSGPATVPPNSPTSRAYHITYPPTTGVAYDNTFTLSSIQLEATPPITFTYSTANASATIDHQAMFGSDPFYSDFPRDLGQTRVDNHGDGTSTSLTDRVLADLNSDGKPDLLDLSSGSTVAWINTGTGFLRQAWGPLLSNIHDDDGNPVLPNTSALRIVETTSDQATTTQDFVDLNGDGYPDIIYFSSSPFKLLWCPGNGHGFETCTLYGPSPTGAPFLRRDEIFGNVQVTDVDFIDIDGDGRADSLSLDTSSGGLTVTRNVGNGFDNPGFGSPYVLALPGCNTAYAGTFPYCIREYYNTSGSPNRFLGAELRDINGDGIPDFLLVEGTIPTQVVVDYGTGTSFEPSHITDPYAPGNIGTGKQSSSGDYLEITGLQDFNGDGLPDIVSADCGVSSTVTVRYNVGGHFDSMARSYTLSNAPPGFLFDYACTHRAVRTSADPHGDNAIFAVTAVLTDMNGDGLPDFVSAELDPNPIPPEPGFVFLVRLQDYVAPRKLVSAQSLNGHSQMSVVYGAQSGDTPYPIHAPVTVTRTRTPLYSGESTRCTAKRTDYTYSKTHFRRSDHTFAGFEGVTRTEDTFATTSTAGYTTADLYPQSGLMIWRDSSNNQASGSSTNTFNVYQFFNPDPEHWIAYLTEKRSSTGTREIDTYYIGFDDYGNITDWTEDGDSGPLDDVIHQSEYVTRDDGTNGFVLSLPSQVRASSVMGGASPTIRYYYDDPAVLGAVPTLGNLAKREVERDPGVFDAKTYTYDVNGNVQTSFDEMGYPTTTTYDSTFGLFPTQTSNSVGTKYFSHHALSGDTAMSCGPQNDGAPTAHWNCTENDEDSIGRTTATWLTTGTSAFALSLYKQITYDDDAYPLSTTVVTNKSNHAVEYRDGFGNPTEVRVEETTGVYRVNETAFDGYGLPIRAELTRRESNILFTHVSHPEAWQYAYDYIRSTIESITEPRDPGDTSPPSITYHLVRPEGVAVIDENGYEVDYYVDGAGRLSNVSRLGDELEIALTTFNYTTNGDISSIIDPNGLTTSYGRSLNGALAQTTTPAGEVFRFQRNARGDITGSDDPRGVHIGYTYDDSGRVLTVVGSGEPSGVRHINSTYSYYSTASCSTAVCAQNNGSLQSETSDGIASTYTYDPQGPISSQRVVSSTVDATLRFSYTIGGQLDQVSYPDGLQVDYTHNRDQSLSALKSTGGGLFSFAASFTYDDYGKNTSTRSEGTSLALLETSTYDARERLTALYSENTSAVTNAIVDDRIALSRNSLPVSISRYGLAPGLVKRTAPDIYSITNDPFGRVTDVLLNGGAFGHYAYDLGDRATTFSELDGVNTTSTFHDDELTERISSKHTRDWKFDAAGSVIEDDLDSKVNRLHSWDGLGRYAQTNDKAGKNGTTTYFYTPSGVLSRITNNGSSDLTMFGQYTQYDAVTKLWSDKVIADGRTILSIASDKANKPYYQVPHHTLNDSIAATTNSHEVLTQEEFMPFGGTSTIWTSGTSVLEPFANHFDNARRDQLMVVGGRAYDANGGVWLGRDHLPLENANSILGDVRIGSMYGFNFQNPYRWSDTSGHCPICVVIGIGLILASTENEAGENSRPELTTGQVAWRSVVAGASAAGGTWVAARLGGGYLASAAGGGTAGVLSRAGADAESGKLSSGRAYLASLVGGAALGLGTRALVGGSSSPKFTAPADIETEFATAIARAEAAGGPTTRLVTRLSQPPQAGRPLSTATGEAADDLARAARAGTTYEAQVPTAVLRVIEDYRQSWGSTTSMGRAQSGELRIYAPASQYIVKYFKPVD